MNKIEIESVCLKFGKRKVLSNISFEIIPGKIIGIVGPNGSGKTSLLKIIAGILRPDSGTVKINGREVKSFKNSEKSRLISYLPQFEENHPFTVFETVMMGRYSRMGRFQINDKNEKEIVLDAMNKLGINHLSESKIYTLSGGERQRVMLARMFAQTSNYLLMDEPLSGLDLKYQIQIASLIKKYSKSENIANILVLHNLNLVSELCDEVIMISDGEQHCFGAPKVVFTEPNIKKVFSVDSTITQNLHATNVDIKFVS